MIPARTPTAGDAPSASGRSAAAREPGLAEFLAACPTDDAEALAQMIDADGRARLLRGERLTLDDYLTAMPSIRSAPVALDAAIDMALRSMAGAARPTRAVVERLVAQRPDLERQIRDAALLGSALWSTDQSPPHRSRYADAMPCDFGEPLPSGQAPYRLVRLLGSGSTGEVFLAEDTQLSEEGAPSLVAIKSLATPSKETWARRRLVEEAAKARRVDHPNVVRALHCGVTPYTEDYIAYEFVDGNDLFAWAAEHGLPRPEGAAAAWVRDVARAVHAAHSVGLAHCDLKPANILVTPGGQLKVTDFGIAVRWQEAGAGRGAPRAPGGTLAFMSPEQYRREDGASAPPADIYALGGLLYWLLTGRLPNGVTPEEIAVTHDATVGRRAGPSPRTHRRSIDADLDAICSRAMAPRAADRHASAAELADDLQAWLDRRPIRWRKPPLSRIAALWVRRIPWTAALSAAIVLGAMASGAALWRFSTIAAERRAEAAFARTAKLQAEKSWRDAAEAVPTFTNRFQNFMSRGWAEQGLAMTTAFQALFGEYGANMHELADPFLERRLEILGFLAETARDPEGKPSVARLAWQLEMAFLLAGRGAAEEPLRFTKTIRTEWQPALSSADPIWNAIDIIEAAATVTRLLSSPSRDREQFAQQALFLRERADALKRGRDWGPLRALALSSLVSAYGPQGLNDPDRAAVARRELDAAIQLERFGLPVGPSGPSAPGQSPDGARESEAP